MVSVMQGGRQTEWQTNVRVASKEQSGGEGQCQWSATEALHVQRERRGAAGTRPASPAGGSASASAVAQEAQQPLQFSGCRLLGSAAALV